MLRHIPELPPEDIFPVDPWKIEQLGFEEQYIAQEESIFTVANGYLGLRGSFEEGRPVEHDETFVNGFYETWPIVYGESAYGFAKTGQTIVNVSNAKIIKIYVDDEPFVLGQVELRSFRRALNMKDGTLDREVVWETASGKRVRVESRRLVSFRHRHLAAIDCRITLIDDSAPVVVSSEVFTELGGVAGEGSGEDDPRKAKKFQGQVLEPRLHEARGRRVALAYRTRRSGIGIACGIDHLVEIDGPVHESIVLGGPLRESIRAEETAGRFDFRAEARAGQTIRVVKLLSYHTGEGADDQELITRVHWSLDRGLEQGFEGLLRDQVEYMDAFWRTSDIRVQGNHPRAQQCVRFNLFHLLQAAGRADQHGIPAKGLTGQAYEGHYFWDGEIYIQPFLTYTAPRLARRQLENRHRMLDKARERAREVNQRGALYPWRTINGEEASAYYAAGTAQYHINADIAYALRRYVQASGDTQFLHDHGAEILAETARLWLDLGFYQDQGDGRFHIHGVTGPDEYTAVVNDNLYTNLMARENLRYAAEVFSSLRLERPVHFERLAARLGLEPEEIEQWRTAAEAMYIPFDTKLGIHPQDSDFLRKKVWDLPNTPRSRFPLMLSYHPLVLYRHQVIKQADVVLAMFLLGHEFTAEQKKRNFDYYEKLTTGDSSLSACIQAIIAYEVGDDHSALKYMRAATLMDLADVGGNVRDGIHVASAGGTWMSIVYGIAGFRDHGGRFRFRPRLPDGWDRLSFRLTIRGSVLEVDLLPETATYRLIEGAPLTVEHELEPLTLAPGAPVRRPITSTVVAAASLAKNEPDPARSEESEL